MNNSNSQPNAVAEIRERAKARNQQADQLSFPHIRDFSVESISNFF